MTTSCTHHTLAKLLNRLGFLPTNHARIGGNFRLISAIGGLHQAIMHALMGTLLPLVPWT